jgi:antitoxin VapB
MRWYRIRNSETQKVRVVLPQAVVSLSADLRFGGSDVFIRRDPGTGHVVLSHRPESWDSFFKRRLDANVPNEFMDRSPA